MKAALPERRARERRGSEQRSRSRIREEGGDREMHRTAKPYKKHGQLAFQRVMEREAGQLRDTEEVRQGGDWREGETERKRLKGERGGEEEEGRGYRCVPLMMGSSRGWRTASSPQSCWHSAAFQAPPPALREERHGQSHSGAQLTPNAACSTEESKYFLYSP